MRPTSLRAGGTRIHELSLVDAGAKMGSDVEVGPFCVVGPDVSLDDGCRLISHVSITGCTTVGAKCEFYPGSVIGMPPQDLKYMGERTSIDIGSHNIFREHVTVHPGTENGGGRTRIGSNNLLLANVHIAHDCQVGDKCVLANSVQLAGHVQVESNVVFGGGTGVHHFVTIGRYAFVGGMSRITQDVPPFMISVAARGPRSEIRMINGVGLQRAGFKEPEILALKEAYLRLFSRRARASGAPIINSIYRILSEGPDANVDYLCRFLLRAYEHGRHGRYLESLRHDSKWRRPLEGDGQPGRT
ncbi:MAG: acyl-ACP--UDP-N-acetylglucosamine O-acyltransferase [Phycisphaerales bacterium]|nr:acyl-ACP--UDP-N-acetylglucosamine O-acyltransferase [Phycisphaerales bacterium]